MHERDAHATVGDMRSLVECDVRGLEEELARREHKAVHARAILRAFYTRNGVLDVDRLEGSNGMKEFLRELVGVRSSVMVRSRSVDGTTKLLVGFL
ncbi:MAG TPA: hypothetical protein VF669_23835, partial [Tepidisphaeraceae bacterium]